MPQKQKPSFSSFIIIMLTSHIINIKSSHSLCVRAESNRRLFIYLFCLLVAYMLKLINPNNLIPVASRNPHHFYNEATEPFGIVSRPNSMQALWRHQKTNEVALPNDYAKFRHQKEARQTIQNRTGKMILR